MRGHDLLCTADQVEDLGGDFLLAALVVFEREVGKQAFGVVRSGLHRDGAGSMFGRHAVQEDGEDLEPHHLRQQGIADLCGGGFKKKGLRSRLRAVGGRIKDSIRMTRDGSGEG